MSSAQPSVAAHGGETRTLSVEESLEFAAAQVRGLVERAPGQLPTYTSGGAWVTDADPWAPNWAGGFLTGMLWIFARRSGEAWWREHAERYCEVLEPRADDTTTHDLGFVLEPSWGRWYELEPTERAREVLVRGGRTMAGRLQPRGGYLSTWVDPGSTFIDVMMNVGIIFRAAALAGDDALGEVAMRHCMTSRRYLMRGDGSTVHEGWFDLESGEFLRCATHQGWRSDSSWARGQAWAIYGFGTAHRHSGEPRLLDAARRAADFYIEHTPGHGIPPNDWNDPDGALPREASAAAITAAGLLRLSELVDDGGLRGHYRAYAERIVETLRSTEYIAADAPGYEGILRHATYHFRDGLGVDESVMWGDYYFVEALDLVARGQS
ncbi:MAG: glycosyl hydrolase [Solirubrobacterales bacterium]|nr:glycosyl hydrolase [Solirubrobacterales bacterium]